MPHWGGKRAMFISRLVVLVVFAAGLAVISIRASASFREPESNYDPSIDRPDPDADCQDKLSDYRGAVEKCLKEAADLDEAQDCYEADP